MMFAPQHFLKLAVASFIVKTGVASSSPSDYFPLSESAPYISWFESRGADIFSNSAFLPSTSSSKGEGVAIHWKIDDDCHGDTAMIHLAVAAPASGWVGFGIAEAGGMPGSDIVLYSAATNAIEDMHVKESYVAPTLDSSQDWTLVHSQLDDGFIIFEAERLLRSGDPQDRDIHFDGSSNINPHRVIAAWGDSEAAMYHGDKNARSAIRFHPIPGFVGSEKEVFEEQMDLEAEGYVDLLMDNYAIPTQETTYLYICFGPEDLAELGMPEDRPLHVIGHDTIVDSSKHLHHTVYLGVTGPELECSNLLTHEGLYSNAAPEYFGGYTPGQNTHVTHPEEAGVPLGKGGYSHIVIQFHYDNRWGDDGATDSSGLRIYYTSQKRKHDIGVFLLGDGPVVLAGQPVGEDLTKHDFDCPSTCTAHTFQDKVTVFDEYLHMHENGAVMSNEVIRNGEVVHKAFIDFWDFDQAGIHVMQQEPYTVEPGDSFRTSCGFNTRKGQDVVYGFGSKDEMCQAYIFYYPKQATPLGVCGPNWSFPSCTATFNSSSIERLERSFGGEKGAEEEEGEGSSPATMAKSLTGSTLAMVALVALF